jgi:hypothetical protein
MINGEVELDFGDGRYVFNVAPIGKMLELEEKCNAGVYEIFQRIADGKARINDIRETIRIGLIGGGAKPIPALKLIERYVDGYPLSESLPIARTILLASIVGVPGDEVGKKAEADQTVTEAAPASSDPQSTALGPLSDFLPDKSMKSQSGNSLPASMDGETSMEQSRAQSL